MKTNPNDSAQPVHGGYMSDGDYDDPRNGTLQGGLTKREHFAAMSSDDFESLRIGLQIEIVGDEPPHYTRDNETSIIYNIEYAKWLAKGRAIWKVMQADALIEALNKETNG